MMIAASSLTPLALVAVAVAVASLLLVPRQHCARAFQDAVVVAPRRHSTTTTTTRTTMTTTRGEMGHAFGSPPPLRKICHGRRSLVGDATLFAKKDEKEEKEEECDYMEEINFFKANVPDDIRNEIFEAESNTKAGKERNGRLATYTSIIVFGLAVASFNTFLTGLVDDGEDLSTTAFGWIATNNPLNEFLFLNKIGGAVALVSAGVCGVLAEIELRARRDNVEKIWREVRRRREEREKSTGGSSSSSSSSSRRREERRAKKAQKQKRRLAALSEVVDTSADDGSGFAALSSSTALAEVEAPALASDGKEAAVVADTDKERKKGGDEGGQGESGGGILGKMKDLYKKADDMAAAQALLLNKELEDRGLIDKITDETGLKVIGKEAAEKLKKQNETDDKVEGGGSGGGGDNEKGKKE